MPGLVIPVGSMPRCPTCAGFVVREPATVRCVLCGRWGWVIDADEQARIAQRWLDWILRPTSAECRPEYQDLAAPPTAPGWLRLPGEPRGKRKRRRTARRAVPE